MEGKLQLEKKSKLQIPSEGEGMKRGEPHFGL